MTGYRTEQKKMLLDFLSEQHERAYTIEEAVAALRERCGERAPGKSTVYRLMQRLVEEGAVKRLSDGNSRRFVYQLMACEDCCAHLHMKCRACGRLFHLEENASRTIAQTLEAAGGFSLSEADTVLFGECATCHREKGVRT